MAARGGRMRDEEAAPPTLRLGGREYATTASSLDLSYRVRTGAYVRSAEGRWGVVTAVYHDRATPGASLLWLDNESKCGFIDVSTLVAVVASKADIAEGSDAGGYSARDGAAVSSGHTRLLTIEELREKLPGFSKLRRLDLSGADWLNTSLGSSSRGGLDGLWAGLRHGETIEELKLGMMRLGPRELAAFTRMAVPSLKGLRSLDLSGNPLSGGGVDDEGKVVSKREYYGGSDDISGITALVQALKSVAGLTDLGVSNCGLPAEGLAQVAAAIKGMSALTSLDCSHNNMGPAPQRTAWIGRRATTKCACLFVYLSSQPLDPRVQCRNLGSRASDPTSRQLRGPARQCLDLPL